jgi:beta-lactam-binding protein with PASTA domain
MFRRRSRVTEHEAAAPPPAGRYVEEQVVTPPPKRPLLWPWLLLLLALVLGGIAAAYLLTRDNDQAAKPRVPDVVGLSTEAAIAKLGERGYPAIVQGRVSPGANPGTVVSQSPEPGTRLDRSRQVTIFVARAPSQVDVPNVVGLPVTQAFVRLQAAKLKGRPVEVAASQPKGQVVKQAPPAGALVKKGSTVVLTVSKGPRLVVVPNVVGQTEATATATLTRLGFRLSISRVPPAQPRGTVLSQQPPAGTRAPKGSVVGLNVSTGSTTTGTTTTGTTTTPRGTVTMPNVVGKGQAAAFDQIERVGLKVDSYPIASSRPRGTVVSQRPSKGTRLPTGSKVRINVSLGAGARPTRIVPDVTGQDERSATRMLIGVGFTVRTVDRETADPSQKGLVQDQRPAPNQSAQAGSQVVIYVARLPSA